jgi:predicted ribosomally synthesized peptide with SipW-like signal peptide
VKKILLLATALIAVIATMGVGTWAYFNDTATATSNTITAGTLSLTVNGDGDGTIAPFDIGGANGLAPGDTGNAATWEMVNTGTISAILKIEVGTIDNFEADDTTPSTSLKGMLKVAMWVDVDKDGTWSSGDYYLNPTTEAKVAWASGSTLPTGATGAYDYISAFDGDVFDNLATVAGGSTSAGNFRVEYDFYDDNTDQNAAQGEIIHTDLTFTLTQA